MYRQTNPWSADPIKRRKAFRDLHLRTGDVVIAQTTLIDTESPIAEEKMSELMMRAEFPGITDHLNMCAQDYAWPWRRSDNDVELEYFGSQYYAGALHNYCFHGRGCRIFISGDTYKGFFASGMRHGSGTMIYSNGDVYEGSWSRNEREGKGRYIEQATKNVYEGGWREGRKYGEGVTHWKKAEEGESMCRVCWECKVDAAFFDCGHVVCCLGCARRVDTCPVCRKKVLSALKLYYVA